MFRSLLVKSAIILAGVAVGTFAAALALEGWLRCAHRLDLQQYAIRNYLGPHDSVRFRPARDILLGWEHAVCTPEDPFGNKQGYPVRKGRGVYRVLVIGDSITEDGRYVRLLEKFLNGSRHANAYEVWNGGTGGYNLRQYYFALQYKGFALDPDLIILGLCLNDSVLQNYFASRDSRGKLVFFDMQSLGHAPPRVNRALFFHSYAYRFFVAAVLRGAHPDASSEDTALWSLRMIAGEARRRQIPVLAVIFPYLKSAYMPNEAADYAKIKDAVADSGLRALDLHGAFADIDDPGWRNQPDDMIHPSTRGHDVIAEKIFEELSRDPGFWYKKKP